jgi:hypothetical protein
MPLPSFNPTTVNIVLKPVVRDRGRDLAGIVRDAADYRRRDGQYIGKASRAKASRSPLCCTRQMGDAA